MVNTQLGIYIALLVAEIRIMIFRLFVMVALADKELNV